MKNEVKGGVITPTRLNVYAFQYMMTFVKCYNELSKFYKTEEGQLFLNYENAKRLLNLYCNYQELQFYKKNESELGLLPRMIELEAKVSQKKIKDNILTQAKADAQSVNINDLLMIVESSENQTYYIPFDVFLNATRIVKLYVEVALGYDHYEKMLYSANGFIRDLKAYQSLLKELGISVKKQFTFHDNSIINTTNSLLNENKK